MNVIYALSHLTDWIDFAKEMRNRLQWEPVYWITTDVTNEPVAAHFPNCVRQTYLEVIQGKSPLTVDLGSPAVIDEHVIREYAFEMDIAFRMMDRLDPGNTFSYNERKTFFLRLLNYSINTLNYFKPDIIVFTEVPHHTAQYVLYVVLKRNGVKTIMFKPIFSYEVRLLIYQNIDEDPFKTSGLATISELPDEVTVKKIEKYVDRLNSDYSLGSPDYSKKAAATQSHSRTFFKTLIKLARVSEFIKLFNPKLSTNIIKLKNKRIGESIPNRLQLYTLKWKGSLKKQKLKSFYKSLQAEPDLSQPFIFVPLQYQPERTSSPDAGVYVEQILMIRMLRKHLPNNMRIYVKEHSAQFHPRMEGQIGRHEFNYEDISILNEVTLVPLQYSSFDLIDKCVAVATLTGTTGIEAIARSKPVMVFGAGCWYRSLPGVFFTPNSIQLKQAIQEIMAGHSIDRRDLIAFLKNFHRISFVGKLNPAFPVSILASDNSRNFVSSVVKYWEQVMNAE